MDPMWLRTAIAAIFVTGCAGVPRPASAPSGSAAPPLVPLSQANHVVFLCNGSGSMAGSPEELWRPILRRLVLGLESDKSFNIIFFQHVYDGAAESWFCALDDHLLTASDHNQAKALSFIQRHGVSDTTIPLDGIDEAFRERPDQILLLTDSNFAEPSDEIVRERVAGLNRRHRVRLDIVVLLDEMQEKQEESILAPLQQIARENNGTCLPLYLYDRH
jgi:hypothetical protein